VFGDGVLSTEELVALYSNGAPASEKKLISLLEDALASAHAERVRSKGAHRHVEEQHSPHAVDTAEAAASWPVVHAS
jgi:hypothetical protein